MSILVITYSMMEARRIADRVAYLHLGALREIGLTEQMLTAAKDPRARAFMAGHFGRRCEFIDNLRATWFIKLNALFFRT
ncbi:MAG: hypothetical protein ACFB11_18690 [Paracoccaceae bacterium]